MMPATSRAAMAARRRRSRVARVSAVLFLTLGLAACGPPITVRRVPARQVSAELARSALNSDSPSIFSENVLNRWGLTEQFRRNPAAALDVLHERLVTVRHPAGTLFALAELCFKHAEDSGRREYDLAAAVFAYAFLFPDDKADRPDRFDPRLRIATDLYNRALTAGFASPDGSLVDLHSGDFALPFGQKLSVTFDEQSLEWANRWMYGFVPVAELEVRGLGARFRDPGLGAPLAASTKSLDATSSESLYLPPEMKVPTTALLRIPDPRTQATQPTIESTLRVYNRYETDGVEIAGERVPLESEPSATLAYSLSRSRIWRFERFGILRGDLISSEIEQPLTFLEPYRPGRIPVVFVHGTGSSPGRWADMINVLANDRRLRGRFQFWFFFYDSGNAIPYSAMRLRQALSGAVDRLDPGHRDPALQQMVVIGHSQGGLLTHMTAIESGDRFWKGISSRPIDELYVSEETRELLRQVFVFEPLPFVKSLVFIATPHRGAALADSSFASLLARFVQLPQTLAGATGDLVTGNPDALRFDPRRPVFGSVYGMRPGSVLLEELVNTLPPSGVKAHSIIPVRGDLPPYGQTDGVVRYDSAHLDWVASELVVPRSGHSVQRNPIAIEEVRRILVEHADQVCDDDAVACPRRLESRPPGDRFAAEPATVELDVPEGERETLPLAEPGADDSSGADDPADDVR